MYRTIAAVLTLAFLACGGKKGDAPKSKEDATSGPAVAPLAMPPSGVDKIARMNFVYGDGWPTYDKAVAAKAKKDWAGARSFAEASVAKDPFHLDAHRVLAVALAQSGEHAAVVDHLVTALADDYWRYGPTLEKDAELAEFFATPHGQSVVALSRKLKDDYQKRIASGVWLIGRRSTFKWPKDLGVQPATTRGELYAFDRETRRYLRLTHTEHRVAGFVRAPCGTEVAIIGFDKIDRSKATPDAPATYASAWVMVLETAEWKTVGPKISLGAAKEIGVGYGAGDQLLVVVDGTVSSVDKATGKATKVATPAPVPRIALTLEEGRVIHTSDGVKATWTGDPATAPALEAGGPAIQIPESGLAAQASVALSPGGAHLVFATAVDPCAKDLAPSLYVADAKKGTIKHLLTARSRFPTRWIDATTLAYEDGEGAIRLWDASTGREVQKLENKVGIALDVLSIAPAPLCKATPPTVDTGSGSADEPLPPEEGSGGPVVSPQ
ncbi:hypothetical protein BH11MYX3_BH11MYX3_09080 [soil metagenome]